MAVTATFVADFSNFTTQVDRAIVTLRKFETSTVKVESALDRMVDSFSGRKLIEQATLAARAVDEIGGSSQLTQKELQRVGTLAAEAAEKLRAMGQDVPPKLQALADAVAKPNAAMSIWNSTIAKVGATIAASFTVGAIAGAIRSTGQWAGHIDDLSKKLGISAEAVQRLDFAAKQNGASIDQVGQAMTLLSKNLVEGDGAAVPALERLNLSFADLKALRPDEAFKRVAVAIADLPSDTERLATAQQLLGRSGADLIPMFQTLEADMRKATVVSAEMIKAGDTLGDSWDQLVTSGKALLVSALVPLAPALQAIADKASAAAQAFLRFRNAQASLPALDLRGPQGAATRAGTGLFDLAAAQVGLGELFNTQLQQGKNAAFTQAALGAISNLPKGNPFQAPGIEQFEKESGRIDAALKRNQAAAKQAADATNAWHASIAKANEGAAFMAGRFGRDLPAAIEAAADSIEGRLIPAVQQAQPILDKLTKAIPAAIKSQDISREVGPREGLLGSLRGNLSSLLEGFTGGGGAAGLFKNLGGSLIQGFGNVISSGLSSLISSGIGLLGKGIGKLFGGLFGGEGKKVNDLRDSFIGAAGGIDVLAQKAQQAGTSIDRLLSAKKVKDFESAVADLQQKMGDFTSQQEADQARLQAALEKYKFTFEQIGPALQKQRLDEQANELIEDWRVLVGAGIDLNIVNEQMSAAINEYLQAALKVGAEVPAAFRPILQKMLETGQLTDEAGVAFNSLEAAGLRFSATLTDVVNKLDELIAKLIKAGETGFGLSAPSLPNIPQVESPQFPEFDTGTRGRFLDFGAGTPVMLHGRERVMTQGEGSDNGMVVDAINRLSVQLLRTVRQVGMASRDAVLIANGRTV